MGKELLEEAFECFVEILYGNPSLSRWPHQSSPRWLMVLLAVQAGIFYRSIVVHGIPVRHSKGTSRRTHMIYNHAITTSGVRRIEGRKFRTVYGRHFQRICDLHLGDRCRLSFKDREICATVRVGPLKSVRLSRNFECESTYNTIRRKLLGKRRLLARKGVL